MIIHYLRSYFQLLSCFIRKQLNLEIPRTVSEHEVVVRSIVHPLFVSSKTGLKREAFLPPPNGSDVSTLRLFYTSPRFCKRHSQNLRIGTNKYTGLATIMKKEIAMVCKGSPDVKLQVLGTPLDADNTYYPSEVKAYPKDKGLPMHSDLVYNMSNISGEPQTMLRVFANKIVSKAKYYPDHHPEEQQWKGKSLWILTAYR